jgi:hypothetical protein
MEQTSGGAGLVNDMVCFRDMEVWNWALSSVSTQLTRFLDALGDVISHLFYQFHRSRFSPFSAPLTYCYYMHSHSSSVHENHLLFGVDTLYFKD